MVPDQPVLPRHADAVGRPPGSEPDHAGTVRKSSPRERLESVIAAAGPGEDEAYVQALRDYQA